MKNSFLVGCVFIASQLVACGGGGGGGSPDVTPVVTPPGPGGTTVTASVIGSAGQLVNPQHMTYQGGDLYLVDRTNGITGTVKKFSTSGNQIGSDIGVIEYPVGVAFDSSANMYVTGRKPSAGTGVLQVASNGTVTEKVIGLNPSGLVIDSSSYTYVADPTGSNVLRYTAGFGSSSNISTTGQPVGLAYDSATSAVFITRYSGDIQGVYRFSTTANPVTAVLYASSSYFNQPDAIAVRASPLEIYVVNTGGNSSQRSVLKISNNGSTVETYLSATNANHKLCNPTGIATDGVSLYIVNSTCSDGYSPSNTGYAKSLLKVNF